MTPQEWSTFVLGWHRRHEIADKQTVTAAWLTAMLTRTKDFPSLASLLTPPVEAEELPAVEAERQATMLNVIAGKLLERDVLKQQKDSPSGE